MRPARMLAFSDGAHQLWVVRTSGGAPVKVAFDKDNEIHDQAFSPDGRWLAFSLTAVGRRRDLCLYEIATGRLTRLGDGSSIDQGPSFSPDGKWLYFVSNRSAGRATLALIVVVIIWRAIDYRYELVMRVDLVLFG